MFKLIKKLVFFCAVVVPLFSQVSGQPVAGEQSAGNASAAVPTQVSLLDDDGELQGGGRSA